jgi:hypothetical protein
VFVFLQVSEKTPPIRLQQSEIAGYRWIPIDLFLHPQRQQGQAQGQEQDHPRVEYFEISLIPLLRWLGLDPILVPSIILPPPSR